MNRDMVDLDVLDDEDADWLRGVVTHAPRADRLARSPSACSRTGGSNVGLFTKIFPKDYKRVLEAQRDAIERGVDVDEAVMAAARG